MFLSHRPRRNRKHPAIRDMIAETSLSAENLIWPVFFRDGGTASTEIKTMPGQYRWNVDDLLRQMEVALKLGINSFALFPAIDDSLKNSTATESLNENGLLPKTLRRIKKELPEAILISDVAMDPYSSDGHDGFVQNGQIINDITLEILAKMALLQAQSGADIVAPSDMMDGRIGYIRDYLDEHGQSGASIMAYTAKYASGFYGPFRDALDSAPKFGDKKTYQMDYRNRTEALRELELDISEGADFVMVKPAWSYLDVISDLKQQSSVPVAAYNVSGEYAMIKAAAKMGMLNEEKAMLEMLYSIKRAGADIILTYFALDAAKILKT